MCTALAGKAIKGFPRDHVVISSKWGPMRDEKGNFSQDNSPEYCCKSLMASMKRLGVDYIDLYIVLFFLKSILE